MSDDSHRQRPSRETPRCPICGRRRVHDYRPFCSARCRDVDLGRWFGEAYRVPAAGPGDEAGGGEMASNPNIAPKKAD